MIPFDKVKIMIILLIALCIIATLYIVFFRPKRIPFIKTSHFHFNVPHDQVKKIKLANGMTALLFKTTTSPKVLVQIAYDIGSCVEGSTERGLAHLIEHMIFKGTSTLAEGDIDAIARKYGATFNAFTGMDITSYYFEADKNNWQPFIGILADCMQNARFDEQHLASEIKTVIQELRMLKDNYWRMMLDKAMQIIFPSNHPYHFPVIGYKEELLNLSAENLKAFYKKYYQPSHATLFIMGDFDEQEAQSLIKEYFEPIEQHGEHIEASFPTIIPEAIHHHTRMYEDIKKEQLGFYWIIPGLKAGNVEVPALIEFILGYGEGGRLFKTLVDDKKVAASVYVNAYQFMEAGVFLILIEPMSGCIDECRKIVSQEMHNLMRDGVNEEELSRAVRTKGRIFFERLQSYQNFTYVWLQSYFSTRNERDVFGRINRLEAVTSQDISTFATTHLDPFFMNQIEMLPLPQERHQLHETIKKHTHELDEKILHKYVRTAPLEQPKYVHQTPPPQPLSFTFPKPDREFTLSNGLNVMLCKQKNLPLICVDLLFQHADYIASSLFGIKTHVMMDMLMEGTKQYSKNDNVTFFNTHGTSYRFDATGAGLMMLNDNYEAILERFVTILTHPTFPNDALEKNKAIFNDSYERNKDVPFSVMERAIKRTLYPEKDYGWTFDQAIEQVTKLNRVDLCKLHMQFVCAQNMILAVVGDFDLDHMQACLEKTCKPLQSGSITEFSYPKPSFEPKKQIDEYMLRDQAIIALCQPSPLHIYHEDIVPVRLLNIIAFKELGSRLYEVREKTGLFYMGFGNFAASASREPGFDYVGALLNIDNTEKAESLLRTMLNTIAQQGITQQELDNARQIYLKGIIDRSATIGALSSTFTLLKSLALDSDYYDKMLETAQNMSLEIINKKAGQYFIADNMARIRIGRIGKK